MPDSHSCDYAFVRVVPRVEREEFINVGVILFCRPRRFLEARIALDRDRLAALTPGVDLDVDLLQAQLDLIPLVAKGGRAAGPIGELPQADRWHWLVSPRSTIIQVSPAHCLLCDDPATALKQLMRLVMV
jgi:hypothetical protein